MEKDIFNINKNQLLYGRGYVYSLQHHLVWCTKYRKKVLKDGIDLECKKILQDLQRPEGKRKEKALSTGIIPETFVFAGKVEEDADSIQLWCGDTKTEYPGPSDNGDLSSGSQLPDRDLRTGLGRTEGDPGDKKAF